MAKPSARDQYARALLDAHHERIGRSEIPPLIPPNAPLHGKIKIGVIGAGVAGLYVALMLDYLKDLSEKDHSIHFNFSYELLEANPSTTHIGGRLFTYRFPERVGTTIPQPYDYYDVGAMRFPELPWMQPTFDLIGYLDLPLIEYIMGDDAKNNISFFNGIHMSAQELNA
ncbi:Flavin containing amine oxidoreductase [Ceratobasidium sp. AG-Ba]|nr:Flavin containing amine oxidoreductase [Ceratobasidium sp. AG-Ba]